jgi:hypothetical protein
MADSNGNSKNTERDYSALRAEHIRVGGSLKSFADSKGVPYTTLVYWKEKLAGRDPNGGKRRPAPAVAVVPLKVIPNLLIAEIAGGMLVSEGGEPHRSSCFHASRTSSREGSWR